LLFTKVDAENVFSLEDLVCELEKNWINLIWTETAWFLPVSFVKGNHLAMIMTWSNLEEINLLNSRINEILKERIHWEYEDSERQILSWWELIDYKLI
jgi:hypothetical protein